MEGVSDHLLGEREKKLKELTRIFHNKTKLDNVWADEATLDLVIERVKEEYANSKSLFALCHGTRNGFEQNYIASKLNIEIIGVSN